MEIARPSADDAVAAGLLLVEVYEPYMSTYEWWGRYSREMADVAGRAAETTVFVAREAGVVLGTITVDTTFVRKAPHEMPRPLQRPAELRMLAVAPHASGRGVGTALIEAAIEHARSEGWQSVALYTMAAMDAAQRIYGRLGFVRDHQRDEYEGGELIVMGFRLG